MIPIGSHVQRSDLAAAKDVAVPARASHVLVSTTTESIRLTFDGSTAPTAAKGIHVGAGAAPLLLPVEANGTIKMIEEGATAVVDYQFFGTA